MKTTDGRVARSQRTRAAVAEAMLDCMEDGVLRPSAKQVAERAGVSTRAVFRHFDNMEKLLEVAAELQIERVMAQLPEVVTHGSFEQRVDALVEHSARRNEITAPVWRAAITASSGMSVC
jgi:TetR/AcrR family transcriptional regulator of autoinduction and epiphytic fitness